MSIKQPFYVLLLLMALLTLTGCGSTLVSTKDGSTIDSSALKKQSLHEMVQITCSVAAESYYKGHIVQEVKLDNGTEIKAYTRPVGQFSMANCMREGLTSNAVRITESFVGLGKTAFKYTGLYKSASSFLDSTRSVSNSVTNNTSNTDIHADDGSKVVTGNDSNVED